jgi:tetratricopeptide (TPR) repeat protein
MKINRALSLLLSIQFFCLTASPKDANEKLNYNNALCIYEYALTLDNDPYYLNKALHYCELALVDAQTVQERESIHILINEIELKQSTCEQNINHQFEFYSFFKGIPENYGFADDNIEYSFENAIEGLLNLPFYRSAASLDRTNGYSILKFGNLDDEMYDINFQQLVSSTNQYILPRTVIIDLIGSENLNSILRSQNDSVLNLLCSKLGVHELGIFEGNFIHEVDDIIETQFSYSQYNQRDNNISDPLVSFGFSEDRRGVLAWNLSFLLLSSLLAIALMQFISFLIDNRRIINGKLIVSYFKHGTFKSNFILAILSQFLPFVIALVLLHLTVFLTPDPTTHYMESGAIIWYLSCTFLLSILPTFITFLLINKFNLNGFHSLRGYQVFLTSALYGSLSPLFLYYIIKYQFIPHELHLLMLFNTVTIGWIFGKSIELFFKRNKVGKNRLIGQIGTVFVLIAIFITAWYVFHELSISNILLSACITFVVLVLFVLIDKIYKVKNGSSNTASTHRFIDNVEFVPGIFDISKLESFILGDLDRFILIRGPRGIGKTTYLKKVVIESLSDRQYLCFYCDCDQFGDSSGLKYEPFVEAFGEFVGVQSIEDSASIIGGISNSLPLSLVDDRLSDALSNAGRSNQVLGEDFIIDVLDKLNSQTKEDIVFVMEDIQWIDQESKKLFLYLLELLNKDKYRKSLGARVKIILTTSQVSGSSGQIDPDLWLPSNFKEVDFVSFVNQEQFLLQAFAGKNVFTDYTLRDIHAVLLEGSDLGMLITPRYILDLLSRWRDEQVLIESENGLILSEIVTVQDLPNSEDLAEYYLQIINDLPAIQGLDNQRTIRILESAAYLGSSFDIEILAELWGLDLLIVLDYFTILEQQGLVIDESASDNIYSFVDHAFVLALKERFGTKSYGRQHRRQIVVEYHKRWLKLKLGSTKFLNRLSHDELMEIVAKFSIVRHSSEMTHMYHRAISELFIRLLELKEFGRIEELIKTHAAQTPIELRVSLERQLAYWKQGLILPAVDQIDTAEHTSMYWQCINNLCDAGLSDENYHQLVSLISRDVTLAEKHFIIRCIVSVQRNFENYLNNAISLMKLLEEAGTDHYSLLLKFKVFTSDYNIDSNEHEIKGLESKLLNSIYRKLDWSFCSAAAIYINQFWIENDDYDKVYELYKTQKAHRGNQFDLLWIEYLLSVDLKRGNQEVLNSLKAEFGQVVDYIHLRGLDSNLTRLTVDLLKMKLEFLSSEESYSDCITTLNEFAKDFEVFRKLSKNTSEIAITLLLRKAMYLSRLKEHDRQLEALNQALEIAKDYEDPSILDVLMDLSRHSRIRLNDSHEALRYLLEANEIQKTSKRLTKKQLGLLQFQTAQALYDLEQYDEAINYYVAAQWGWSNNSVGAYRKLVTDCRICTCMIRLKIESVLGYSKTKSELYQELDVQVSLSTTQELTTKFGGAAAINEYKELRG